MPLWKYRSVADMPAPPGPVPGSRGHLERWASLWERSTTLAGKRYRQGLFRYRTIEESWEAAHDMERD